MKNSIFIIILIFLSLPVLSQKELSGIISDEETNDPLPGATIYIPELSKGTVADISGHYYIDNLPSGTLTIEFSYMGYHTIVKKIHLSESNTILNVSIHPTSIQTEEVVISSSSYTTQHENAVKIEAIGTDKITTSGQPGIIAAISEIAGVDMITKGNGITKPVIRGLSNSNVVVLYNGVKLENYQFSEDHPFVIDEFGVEQVEVIKGPASLLYGSDAVGGLINIIPEKPAQQGEVIGELNTQYFSNTQGIATGLGVKGTNKQFFWGLNAGWKSHKDYLDGNMDPIINSRFNDQSLKFNTGINKKIGSFQLFYNYNAMKLGMTTPDALTLIDKNERKNEYWYQDLTNHILSSKNKLFFGRYKMGINLAWQYNLRKLHTDEMNEVNMGLHVLSYDVKTWLPSSENTEYIVGFQGAFKDNKNNDGHIRVLPDYTENDVAVLGWIKHKHNNNVNVQAGVRWEFRGLRIPEQEKASHSHDEEQHTEEPNETMAALNRDYYNASFSVGGTWQMSHDFLWRLNIASAYRAPNVAELTQDGVHGSRYEEGNRDLESQRSYEGDLSLHFHSGILMCDLAGFYNHLNRYIYLTPTIEYHDELRVYEYTQADANIYGLEALLSINIRKWLNLNTSYSYLRGKRSDGEFLPYLPQDKILMDLKVEKEQLAIFYNTWLSVGYAFAFNQNRPAQFETSTDPYFLLKAGLGFRIKWQKQFIDISIIGSNLLNETYYDHLSTLKDINLYNMGRNITVNLKIPFGIKRGI